MTTPPSAPVGSNQAEPPRQDERDRPPPLFGFLALLLLPITAAAAYRALTGPWSRVSFAIVSPGVVYGFFALLAGTTIGALLACVALNRREQPKWLGVLALFLNGIPWLGLIVVLSFAMS